MKLLACSRGAGLLLQTVSSPGSPGGIVEKCCRARQWKRERDQPAQCTDKREANQAAPAAVPGGGADTSVGWHKRWLHPCNTFLYYKLLCNKIRPLPN